MLFFSTNVLPIIHKHEGGFSDRASDPGGITNFGISLRFLKKAGLLDLDGDGFMDGDIDFDGDIDADDIRAMTLEAAGKIYFHHWWEKYRYGDLPWPVSGKAVDLSINMGSFQAHKCLQRAVRAADGPNLVVDGLIGSRSLQAIESLDPVVLHGALCSEAAGFYRLLTNSRPDLAEYLNGWLNRAYSQEFLHVQVH